MSFRDPTVLGLQLREAMASFYVGDGNASSGPHAVWQALSLLTHLSISRTTLHDPQCHSATL